MRIAATALAVLAMAASPGVGNELHITGSNVFGETLGPRLVKSFTRANPNIAVTLRRPGTTEGIAALTGGRADIAPSSRLPDRREKNAARTVGAEIVAAPVASYVVRVIIHASNPVKSLTSAQVADIFSGSITHWKQVGGPDASINLFVLNHRTGARAGFREVAMDGRDYASTAQALPSYAEIVQQVSTDPYGLGYTSLGPLPGRVVAVSVDGVTPSADSVKDRTYPFFRPLWLCTLRERSPPPPAASSISSPRLPAAVSSPALAMPHLD